MITEAEKRAIEFEALIAESAVISIEVQGMKYENEFRLMQDHQVSYGEADFIVQAEKMGKIIKKLRALK